MKRPLALTILMWFCAIYAVGAVLGIAAAIFDLGRFLGGYSIGGMKPIIATAAHCVRIVRVPPCKDARLSQQMIHYIESGQRNPTLSTLLRLANALDVDLWKLVKQASTATAPRK